MIVHNGGSPPRGNYTTSKACKKCLSLRKSSLLLRKYRFFQIKICTIQENVVILHPFLVKKNMRISKFTPPML